VAIVSWVPDQDGSEREGLPGPAIETASEEASDMPSAKVIITMVEVETWVEPPLGKFDETVGAVESISKSRPLRVTVWSALSITSALTLTFPELMTGIS
jgi:hypothetical protein